VPFPGAAVPQENRNILLINLNAKSDFEKGDFGRVAGHTVTRTERAEKGRGIVIATQDVKAGMNAWFETQ
jgi:hypothetical protein